MTSRVASPGVGSDGADAAWVESFLRVLPGKTYRVGSDEHERDEAAREALGSAASEFVDEVTLLATTLRDAGAASDVG